MISKKLLIGTMIAAIAALAIPTGIADSTGCNFITGTADADKLAGTDGIDCIDALAGDDKIQAGDSGDLIAPGAGADRTNAGDGDDIVFMEDDDAVDIVNCGDGDDSVGYFGDADPEDILRSCETVADNI